MDNHPCPYPVDAGLECGSPATQRVTWHTGDRHNSYAEYISWRTDVSMVDRCAPHAMEFEIDALADPYEGYMDVRRTNI